MRRAARSTCTPPRCTRTTTTTCRTPHRRTPRRVRASLALPQPRAQSRATRPRSRYVSRGRGRGPRRNGPRPRSQCTRRRRALRPPDTAPAPVTYVGHASPIVLGAESADIGYHLVQLEARRRSEHHNLAPAAPATITRSDGSKRRGASTQFAPRHLIPAARARKKTSHMQSRNYSSHASFGNGASARRRIRRTTAANSLYCRTNGCTTYLESDASGRTAHCPVCGATRTLA